MSLEIVGYENCHLHGHFSLLDGIGFSSEYCVKAKSINQQYHVLTDHGMLGGMPEQIRACEEHKIIPIFGVELYVNPYQPKMKIGEKTTTYAKDLNDEEKKKLKKSCHLIAICYNEIGYKNLVNLLSTGWLHGSYFGKPRVNHEQLLKHKEGIIFSSACYNGEIGWAFDQNGPDSAMDMVYKYKEMFGENFYLELMLLDFNKQKPYDKFLIDAHDKTGIPLILTNDCHYCYKEDWEIQRNLLLTQTGKNLDDLEKAKAENADLFELQDKNLWMKSEEEINEKWEKDYSDVIPYELFKQAKLNTLTICERAKGVKIDRSLKLPMIPNANEQLLNEIFEGFNRRKIPKTKQYIERAKEEYALIKEKEFSSYFLIQKMMTDEARRKCPEILGWGDGTEAVGPARGSAGGSLVVYALGITDVNPIPHDLLFSRFLSPARGGKSMLTKFSKPPMQKDFVEEEFVEEFVEQCPF